MYRSHSKHEEAGGKSLRLINDWLTSHHEDGISDKNPVTSSLPRLCWDFRYPYTLPTAEILSGKNVQEPFGSYLLNSTANPAHFHPNWAGLAVPFSRQLLNGSQDFFFHFNILISIYFFRYKTIETHARAFLLLNISAICVEEDDDDDAVETFRENRICCIIFQ